LHIEKNIENNKKSSIAVKKKANELKNIINKIEYKEERWFELSSKMEG
jgi:ATP-binding cassette subfamily F protein uup